VRGSRGRRSIGRHETEAYALCPDTLAQERLRAGVSLSRVGAGRGQQLAGVFVRGLVVGIGEVACAHDPGLARDLGRPETEGRDRVEGSWFDEESWRDLSGRRDERGNYVRTAAVPLTPLPHRAGLSDLEPRAQRRALVLNMQDLAAQVARKRREDGSRRLPKPEKYTTQDRTASRRGAARSPSSRSRSRTGPTNK
jgi:hypothetical protein